jgi:putative transposase
VSENKVISLEERAKDEGKPFLEQLLQEGARKLLQAAIENEVIDYIQFHKDRGDEHGHRLVVRNGHLPEREVVSGVGPIRVRQPRVRHRDKGRFSSAILPRYMRRTPSVDALIPALYLKGISTGDFTEALEAILGEGASGLSATNIVRLKAGWEADYKAWSQRDLSQKRYVYWWADGVYFNVRLDSGTNLCAGLDRSHRGWHQRTVGCGRRLSRKQSILAGTAWAAQTPGTVRCAEAGHR